MFSIFQKDKVDEEESTERDGGWYADPFGKAARRWYDQIDGWTDRVEGEGEEPDKTGLARMDEAAESNGDEHTDADGNPAPLSRPVDASKFGHAPG